MILQGGLVVGESVTRGATLGVRRNFDIKIKENPKLDSCRNVWTARLGYLSTLYVVVVGGTIARARRRSLEVHGHSRPSIASTR